MTGKEKLSNSLNQNILNYHQFESNNMYINIDTIIPLNNDKWTQL